jgi:hypothetical protein
MSAWRAIDRLRPRRLWPAAVVVPVLGVALGAGTMAARSGAVDSEECEARLEQAVEAISTHPRVKDIPRAQLRATTEFAIGNMLFVLLHEVAHGLIADLHLPVLGREEDAADAFATVTMIKMGTEFSHRTLVNAAKGWLLSDRRSRGLGESVVYYDAHGLDLQRAYNIVCLMVGSDPDKFEDLAKETNLPEDRRDTCLGDWSNASWSWDKALKPFQRPAGQTPTKFDVVYGEVKDPLDIFERAFRATGMMERVGAMTADLYAWNTPFTIETQTCGEPGARWNVPAHKVTMCYEMADEFVKLFKAYGDEPLTALSPAAGDRPGVPTSFKGFR